MSFFKKKGAKVQYTLTIASIKYDEKSISKLPPYVSVSFTRGNNIKGESRVSTLHVKSKIAPYSFNETFNFSTLLVPKFNLTGVKEYGAKKLEITLNETDENGKVLKVLMSGQINVAENLGTKQIDLELKESKQISLFKSKGIGNLILHIQLSSAFVEGESLDSTSNTMSHTSDDDYDDRSEGDRLKPILLRQHSDYDRRSTLVDRETQTDGVDPRLDSMNVSIKDLKDKLDEETRQNEMKLLLLENSFKKEKESNQEEKVILTNEINRWKDRNTTIQARCEEYETKWKEIKSMLDYERSQKTRSEDVINHLTMQVEDLSNQLSAFKNQLSNEITLNLKLKQTVEEQTKSENQASSKGTLQKQAPAAETPPSGLSDVIIAVFYGLLCSLFYPVYFLYFSGQKSDVMSVIAKHSLRTAVIYSFLCYIGFKFGKIPMNLRSHLGSHSTEKPRSWEFLHKSLLWGISLGFIFLVMDYLITMFSPSLKSGTNSFIISFALAVYNTLTHEILYRMFLFSMFLNLFQKYSDRIPARFNFDKEDHLINFISILSVLSQVFFEIYSFMTISGISRTEQIMRVTRSFFYESTMGLLFGYMLYTDEKLESILLTRFCVMFLVISFGLQMKTIH